ncbi:hypothetical protein, partial [Paraburkholderia sp.]|uniref:hypothetical protein n=1 Tax=Paraburkholderia sp. TaxID=1926495 RepID=UPI002AFE4292
RPCRGFPDLCGLSQGVHILSGSDLENILIDPRHRPFVRERNGFSLSGEVWKVDSREDLDLFIDAGLDPKNPRLRKKTPDAERGNAADPEATVGESHR